jgi:hypothetical protein
VATGAWERASPAGESPGPVLQSLTDVISGSPLTYFLVALLVAGDAIVPVFPGESGVVGSPSPSPG